MSEPVSNSEIEDVLSSIRRLVSDDGKGDRDTPDVGAEESGRLVLTPAFRVEQPDVSDSDEENSAENDPIAEIEERFEQADANYEKEREQELVEEPVIDLSDEMAEATTQEYETGDTPLNFSAIADEPIAEWQDVDADMGESWADNPRLSEKVAELEAAIGEQKGEWEPDGSEEDTHTPDAVPEFIRASSILQEVEQPQPDDVESALDLEFASDIAQDVPEPETGSPEIEAEASVGEAQDVNQREATDVDDITSEAELVSEDASADATPSDEPAEKAEQVAFIHRAADQVAENVNQPIHDSEVDAPEETRQEAVEPGAEAEQSHDVEEQLDLDAIEALDEQALRLLVNEIVRQELHGVLGERITRNVRKLVRREVHRVLAARDFD